MRILKKYNQKIQDFISDLKDLNKDEKKKLKKFCKSLDEGWSLSYATGLAKLHEADKNRRVVDHWIYREYHDVYIKLERTSAYKD